MELSLAEAPAVFVCLSCFLARVSLKRSQWKFRFGESLPSSLMSSSERHTAWFSSGVGKMQRSFLFAGEKSEESNTAWALKRFWAFVVFCFCFVCVALCQLQLLLSLYNLIDVFLLFHLLTFHSVTGALCPKYSPFRAAFFASSDNAACVQE